MAIVISIIPSYAADGQMYHIYIIDGTRNTVLYTEYWNPEAEDNNYVEFYYDSNSGALNIIRTDIADQQQTPSNNNLIYSMIIPMYYYVDMEIVRGNSNGQREFGYGYLNEYYDFNMTHDISAEYTNIILELKSNYNYQAGIAQGEDNVTQNPNTYNLYTEEQYTSYGTSRFNNGVNTGIDRVRNNPGNYNLYTLQEYQNYGASEYRRGREDALNGAYTEEQYLQYGRNEYIRGTYDGMAQSSENSKTLIGLANVGVTGVYNVMMNFLNSTSIFGTTIMTIVVSLIIIFVVYLIFKVVRG
jgi:hypothetical protein